MRRFSRLEENCQTQGWTFSCHFSSQEHSHKFPYKIQNILTKIPKYYAGIPRIREECRTLIPQHWQPCCSRERAKKSWKFRLRCATLTNTPSLFTRVCVWLTKRKYKHTKIRWWCIRPARSFPPQHGPIPLVCRSCVGVSEPVQSFVCFQRAYSSFEDCALLLNTNKLLTPLARSLALFRCLARALVWCALFLVVRAKGKRVRLTP